MHWILKSNFCLKGFYTMHDVRPQAKYFFKNQLWITNFVTNPFDFNKNFKLFSFQCEKHKTNNKTRPLQRILKSNAHVLGTVSFLKIISTKH